MKTLDVVAVALLIIGGLNWGLVGTAQFDLVATVFGDATMLSRIVYSLVGLAAVYQAIALRGVGARWSPRGARIGALVLAALTAPAIAEAQGAPASAVPAAVASAAPGTIVEVAVANGNFTTLVAAVKAAGLVETLSGKGPFTVFAPTDAAFRKLPAGTVDGLLADKPALTGVLTFHVIAGVVKAGDIVKAKSLQATTVNGQTLDVRVRDGKVYVNGAQVITADVPASNGVIHVIDAVLLPKTAAAPR